MPDWITKLIAHGQDPDDGRRVRVVSGLVQVGDGDQRLAFEVDEGCAALVSDEVARQLMANMRAILKERGQL